MIFKIPSNPQTTVWFYNSITQGKTLRVGIVPGPTCGSELMKRVYFVFYLLTVNMGWSGYKTAWQQTNDDELSYNLYDL